MKTLRGLVVLMTLSIALMGCDRDQQPTQSGNEPPVTAETTQPQTPAATEAAPGQQPADEQCDRACLIGMVDSYLAALVAHDPAQVTIATDAKFVENVTRMAPGEGLWVTASEIPSTFKIYIPDPVAGQVGFLGVMKETDLPVLLALRLKLADGKLIEMEHLVARNLGEPNLPNLQTPRPGLLTTVPESERMTREELIAIGATYYDALVDDSGSLAPFAEDCVRRENGMQTTSNPPPKEGDTGIGLFGAMGCAAQLDTRVMSYIDSIDNRRVEIADVETGLVFGLSHFRHGMVNKTLDIVGVPGVEKREMNFDPFDLPAAHVYKVTGGKIHEIEAMGFRADYNSPTGWE